MKVIIRETVAMIILIAAIMLIIVMTFFDYIQDESTRPTSAKYVKNEEITNILMSKKEYQDAANSISLSSSSLTVEPDMLSQMISKYDLGQSAPFDEIPITRIDYDKDGNAYYRVANDNTIGNPNINGTTGTSYGDVGTGSSVAGTTEQQTTTTVTNTTAVDRPLYTQPNSGK